MPGYSFSQRNFFRIIQLGFCFFFKEFIPKTNKQNRKINYIVTFTSFGVDTIIDRLKNYSRICPCLQSKYLFKPNIPTVDLRILFYSLKIIDKQDRMLKERKNNKNKNPKSITRNKTKLRMLLLNWTLITLISFV